MCAWHKWDKMGFKGDKLIFILFYSKKLFHRIQTSIVKQFNILSFRNIFLHTFDSVVNVKKQGFAVLLRFRNSDIVDDCSSWKSKQQMNCYFNWRLTMHTRHGTMIQQHPLKYNSWMLQNKMDTPLLSPSLSVCLISFLISILYTIPISLFSHAYLSIHSVPINRTLVNRTSH